MASQADVRLFIHNAIAALLDRTGASLGQLARAKYRLRKTMEAKIDSYRAAQHAAAYQRALFGGDAAIEVVPAVALAMDDPTRYAPNWLYEGAYRFRKHLFSQLGELKDDGEEHDCAIFLDQHESVASWVRNISNRITTSFWLQTSTDRFYPDFVGELTDGRVFAVEYKGADRWSGDDSKEKRAVGELWAAASRGHCVFVMPKGPDWGTIDAAFRAAAGLRTSSGTAPTSVR